MRPYLIVLPSPLLNQYLGFDHEPVNEEVITPEELVKETTPKEKLIQQLKTCVIDGDSCKGLGDKIKTTAEELGVTADELMDEVFGELAKKEQPEDQIQG